MSELNMNSATTTSLNSSSLEYSVSSKTLDSGGEKEYYWYFTDAAKNWGYYKQIPELKKAIDALAMWVVGKGWDNYLTDYTTLGNIRGWGEDSFQSILWNLVVTKKVQGDAFAEIIVDDNLDLINLKPLDPARMVIVTNEQGMIKRYEQIVPNKDRIKYEPEEILHLCNDRVGDEIHGVSCIDACAWVILARNEAMDIYRKILKRSLALGVLYIDSDDSTKINSILNQYKQAIKNGEVLVLPRDTAELKDAKVSVQDFMSWIQYLENFFYQAVGIPKAVIGSSEMVSEGSQKIGYLSWEQTYMSEMTLLEDDLWNQLGIKITFKKPASIRNDVATNEMKNTSQTNFQPKDTSVGMGRE